MKADFRWKVIAGIVFVTVSLLLMTTHFLIFRDPGFLFSHLLLDLAFIPIEVLVVTLIIDSLLTSRERQQKMEKLNMVIGIFFSRVGSTLIGKFAGADPENPALRDRLTAGRRNGHRTFSGQRTGIWPAGSIPSTPAASTANRCDFSSSTTRPSCSAS